LENLIQFIVNGLLIGGVYALGALSLAVIYKSSGIFNFAVGEIMVVGMYSAWALMGLGIPVWICIVGGVIISSLLGFVIERGAMRPLIGQPIFSAILATFAVGFTLKGILLMIWRGTVSKYPVDLPGGRWAVGPITMSSELVWTFAVAVVVVVFVVIFFQRTKAGLGMRATAENQRLAQVRGIPVGIIFSMSWILSAAICGVAGIFISYRLGVAMDVSGVGLAALPAVLLGGLESIPGALLGGLIVGLAVSLTSGYLDPATATIAPFVILLLVLLVKTEGIFGLKRIERI
jgi:branched-chain amino acid transport system permease protein